MDGWQKRVRHRCTSVVLYRTHRVFRTGFFRTTLRSTEDYKISTVILENLPQVIVGLATNPWKDRPNRGQQTPHIPDEVKARNLSKSTKPSETPFIYLSCLSIIERPGIFPLLDWNKMLRFHNDIAERKLVVIQKFAVKKKAELQAIWRMKHQTENFTKVNGTLGYKVLNHDCSFLSFLKYGSGKVRMDYIYCSFQLWNLLSVNRFIFFFIERPTLILISRQVCTYLH